MQLTDLYNYIFNPLFTLGFISLVFSFFVAGFLRMRGDKESVSRSNDIIKISLILLLLFVLIFTFTRLLFTYNGPVKVQSGMESFVKTFCKSEETPNGLIIKSCNGNLITCGGDSDKRDTDMCRKGEIPSDLFSYKCKSAVPVTNTCLDPISDQISFSINAFIINLTSQLGTIVAEFGKDYFFKLPFDIIGHEKFSGLFSSIQSIAIAIVLVVFLFNYWTKLIRVFQDDSVIVFITEAVNYIYAIISIYIFPFILEMIMRICTYLVLVITESSSGKLLADFFVGYSRTGVIMASISPIFMIYYIVIIIALVWLVVKNIKRYVWVLILYMLSPIFGPMYFIDSTKSYFQSFFRSFLMSSFSVVIEVIIIMIGFTLSNIATTEGNIMMGAFAVVTFLLSIGSDTLLREIMVYAGFQQMSSGGRYMKQLTSTTNRMAVNIKRFISKGTK